MNNKKIALVTGANRGLGFEICRQLALKGVKVILTSREKEKGLVALEKLKNLGLNDIYYHSLDVSLSDDIDNVYQYILKEHGHLDILINNAGISIDRGKYGIELGVDTLRKTIETNVFGSLMLIQKFVPMMKSKRYGRIINVSSGMGAIDSLYKGYMSYRLSKTCLNAMTIILADEIRGTNVLINAMDPGWVRTDMGGPNAQRTVEVGADSAVWLALLPDGSPSGRFYRDRKIIPW